MTSEEWESLRNDLADAGVAGDEDLGRFVSNVEFFQASTFDEKAAMPILIKALPSLSDPALVSAVAGHLRRPWARPAAFNVLLDAFRRWAARNPTVGWQLGDALGNAAVIDCLDDLLGVCENARYGTTRQMPVAALARFKRSPLVAPALLRLIYDPDVGLHAMSALRRVLGPAEALPHIEAVEHERSGTRLGEQAARQAKKIRKSVGS
jgi:hypothetical protein